MAHVVQGLWLREVLGPHYGYRQSHYGYRQYIAADMVAAGAPAAGRIDDITGHCSSAPRWALPGPRALAPVLQGAAAHTADAVRMQLQHSFIHNHNVSTPLVLPPRASSAVFLGLRATLHARRHRTGQALIIPLDRSYPVLFPKKVLGHDTGPNSSDPALDPYPAVSSQQRTPVLHLIKVDMA